MDHCGNRRLGTEQKLPEEDRYRSWGQKHGGVRGLVRPHGRRCVHPQDVLSQGQERGYLARGTCINTARYRQE